jgi:type II secretory pathway predicted ATPase ExeA
MLLTLEVGTGKTTLLNRLLDWLHQQQTPTAFIFNPHLGTSHLLDFILGDFEVPADARLKTNPLMRLNLWLIERYRAGHTPVLIVDEAQGLPIPALEEIRMLLNLEAPHEKLLQIVLAGQPEIEERLKRPELRQLTQRIMIRCKTAALTLEETHDYIRARLHIAGANGKPVFTSQAMDSVHFYSQGIPRITNLLCEHALINAYVDQVQPVPAHIIEEIAREFLLDNVKPLDPSIDSETALGVVMVAPQPALANELAPPPAEFEPLLQEKPGVKATCVAPPHVPAETLPGRPKELATQVLDCERTLALSESKGLNVPTPSLAAPEPRWMRTSRKPSGSTAFDSSGAIDLNADLVMEQAPASFSHLLQVFKAKGKFNLSPVSSGCQVVGPQKAARRPTAVNATSSTPIISTRMKLLGLCLSLTHSNARWRKRHLSAFDSPLWRHLIAIPLSHMKCSLQSVVARCRWVLAQQAGRQSAVGSIQWPRTTASLYEWLRQPVDPIQLWWLPYSWLLKARRKLSHKPY